VQQSRVIPLSRGGRRSAGTVARCLHPESYAGRGCARHWDCPTVAFSLPSPLIKEAWPLI